MRRTLFPVVAALLAASMTNPVLAGWSEFWHRNHADYKRNVCWPYPFVLQDRDAVRTPLAMMADNGWRLENTLPDELFLPETQQLTRAGERKVQWIATQAPSSRRAVFVPRGVNEDITNARVTAVQQFVGTLTLRGAPPQVFVTDVSPSSTSGDYFYQVDRKAESSLPDPRLPAATNGNGSN